MKRGSTQKSVLHGRYSTYAKGCPCNKCWQAYKKELKKRQRRTIQKNKSKYFGMSKKEMEEERKVKLWLTWARKRNKNKTAEIREIWLEEVHSKFLEGKRILSKGSTS